MCIGVFSLGSIFEEEVLVENLEGLVDTLEGLVDNFMTILFLAYRSLPGLPSRSSKDGSHLKVATVQNIQGLRRGE